MTTLIVLTGLSGAGRSVAAGALEDSGWFVIDNLPPALVSRVADLADAGGHYERVALAMGSAVADLAAGVDELRDSIDGVSVLVRTDRAGPGHGLALLAEPDLAGTLSAGVRLE